MISAEELKARLKALGRTRDWLAESTGYSPDSVRQYLGKSRRSEPFLRKALEVIAGEERRQPGVPQWNLIFLTEEEFDRADRASHLVGAGSLKDFCREAILARANEILERKRRGLYPLVEPGTARPESKVADKDA